MPETAGKPVAFTIAELIASRVRESGLDVTRVGIFAVGDDGHVRLTIKGSPEAWEALVGKLSTTAEAPHA